MKNSADIFHLVNLLRIGYALAQEHGFLPNQYFLVFRPTRL